MGPRTRILDAAMLVFRRHGFRRSSIEQAAEAAGLTRQALYHHFKSKEALFRAVIERLHEDALAAEIAAAGAAEKQGGSLADILVASVSAKLGQLAASLDGSPHVEELFSEHLLQARDLYQKYTAAYAALLAEVVRDALDLTGTKLVCGAGVCGACTVLVDGEPAVSCLMPARSVASRNVTTVEGIGAARLHPVQKAFMAHDALQCGFCTPGFIVEAAAFHDSWRAAKGTAVPSREEIGAALSGHLCRCGAYDGIFRAVADACAGRFDGNDIL